MDRIRAALGERKISCFGTYLGATRWLVDGALPGRDRFCAATP